MQLRCADCGAVVYDSANPRLQSFVYLNLVPYCEECADWRIIAQDTNKLDVRTVRRPEPIKATAESNGSC